MHARHVVPDALALLATLQGDVVTMEQARAHGIGPRTVERLVRDGIWVRISPGVYRTIAGATPWLSLAWAGVLIGGDRARLGGSAAGHLHGVVRAEPAEILVLTPARSGASSVSGPWEFRRERPGVRSKSRVGSPPRTTVEDTVLDLVDAADSSKAVVDVVTRAVQGRITTSKRLTTAVEGRARLRHRRTVCALLDDVAQGVRSTLKLDFLRNVERAHQLPKGRRQGNQRSTEVDVWYDRFGVVVELDGRLGHDDVEDHFRDMSRDNAATVDGLFTLRYGYADVHDRRCGVAQQIGAVLAVRGWEGPVSPCPLCRNVHSL